VVLLAEGHTLGADPDALGRAVAEWLERRLRPLG
jgi:hypothetical protein